MNQALYAHKNNKKIIIIIILTVVLRSQNPLVKKLKGKFSCCFSSHVLKASAPGHMPQLSGFFLKCEVESRFHCCQQRSQQLRKIKREIEMLSIGHRSLSENLEVGMHWDSWSKMAQIGPTCTVSIWDPKSKGRVNNSPPACLSLCGLGYLTSHLCAFVYPSKMRGLNQIDGS
jgi:hypothetical protein